MCYTYCIKVHKVDCIWFKSLVCGGTLALLTHTALPDTVLLTARNTARQTCSHGYQVSTPTAFMTHIGPAITLAPNNHNKQREGNTFLCHICYTNESLNTYFTLSCRILLFSLPTSINFFQFVYCEILGQSAWWVFFRPPLCCLFLWHLKVIELLLVLFWTYEMQEALVLHLFVYI